MENSLIEEIFIASCSITVISLSLFMAIGSVYCTYDLVKKIYTENINL